MSFQLAIAEENFFKKIIFPLTDYLLTDQSSKSYSPTKTTQFLRLLRTYLTKRFHEKESYSAARKIAEALQKIHFLREAQGHFQKSLLIFWHRYSPFPLQSSEFGDNLRPFILPPALPSLSKKR